MKTIQQELEQERQLDRIDDKNRETNTYKELIVNNAEKLEPLMTQMEQWSILSNVLNYIQHDRYPKTYHSLSVNAVNKHKINTKEKGDIVELDFGTMPEVLKEEYLDVYDGIQSEVVSTTRFDENLDLSTAYLGRYQISHSVIESIWKVLSETELKFSSKLTSFCSQTWLLLLICLGKCFPLEYPKECCSI